MPHTKEKYWHDRVRGLCVSCGLKAVTGRTRCQEHLERFRQHSKKERKKRQTQGRCDGCGWPLHPEMDEGHKKCLACRQEVPKRRFST